MNRILIISATLLSTTAHSTEIKVPPNPAIKAWICGYSAGFEDAIRQKTDARTPESVQCEKFRAQAKSVIK
jgi:hypothetical protein